MAETFKTGRELERRIADFYADPWGFVLFAFPWGEGALKDAYPDEWQKDILITMGKEVERGADPTAAAQAGIQIAVTSGHGIGKTALIAWIIYWFMSTRPNPQVVVTANTGNQLNTKTWRELAKWHKIAINTNWFEHTAKKFYHKRYPDTWFATPIPWSKDRAEAFAGTHEKHVLVVFDEGSAIDDIIWEVTEGAMTTKGAMWVVFGNPTRNTGRFRECWGRFRERWITRQISSYTAKMTNKAKLDEWIEDYGEDSDFCKVRIFGQFPSASSCQFIASNDVEAAIARVVDVESYYTHPCVISTDVARFGDDKTVITIKQGRKVFEPIIHMGLDTMQVVDKIIEVYRTYESEHYKNYLVVDGTGLGAGVVDRLRQLGYEVTEYQGAASPRDKETYVNLRAEVWGLMRDAIKEGLDLPDNDELRADLIGLEYGFSNKNQIRLEKKEDMKSRGLPSPDLADSLSMCYMVNVHDIPHYERRTNKPRTAKFESVWN